MLLTCRFSFNPFALLSLMMQPPKQLCRNSTNKLTVSNHREERKCCWRRYAFIGRQSIALPDRTAGDLLRVAKQTKHFCLLSSTRLSRFLELFAPGRQVGRSFGERVESRMRQATLCASRLRSANAHQTLVAVELTESSSLADIFSVMRRDQLDSPKMFCITHS